MSNDIVSPKLKRREQSKQMECNYKRSGVKFSNN